MNLRAGTAESRGYALPSTRVGIGFFPLVPAKAGMSGAYRLKHDLTRAAPEIVTQCD